MPRPRGNFMTILRNILLLLLILTFPVGAFAEKNGLQQVGVQIPPAKSLAKACTGTSGGQFSCGMLLVLGGILDKEHGLTTLEYAARNGDKTAIAALYSVYARGSNGVPKDMERAEYWAKLGGITVPCYQTGKRLDPDQNLENQEEEMITTEPTPTPCDHNDVRLNTLERNAVAGDKTAGELLFDLYLKGRYTPCPEVKAALVKRGLLTEVTAGED